MNQSHEEFLQNLKEKLDQEHSFPMVYLFKFIVPNDNKRLAEAQALFGGDAEVRIQESSKGKYVSVSAKEVMVNSDAVIEVYKRAATIDGIVSL